MNFKSLTTFALSPNLSDFEIQLPSELSSEKFPLHKIILASNSNFFLKYFEQNPESKIYKLPTPISSIKGSITSEIISKLIKFCYKEQNLQNLIDDGLNPENSFKFLSVAKLFDFETSKKIIFSYIEERNFKKENYLDCLIESIKFSQEDWVFSLIKKISLNMNFYLKDEISRAKLLDLPFEHCKALLSRDDLFVENEDLVFKFVLDYIKKREVFEEEEILEGEKIEEENKEEGIENKEDKKKVDKKKVDKKKEDKKNVEKEENKEGENTNDSENLEKEALLLLKNYKLNQQKKKDLLNLVRLSYVSHQFLIQAVKEQIIGPFHDIILEAISAKLSSYETANTNYSILLQPRECYAEKKHKNKLKKIKKPPQTPEKQQNSEKSLILQTPTKTEDKFKDYESIKSNFLDKSYKSENKKKYQFIFSHDFDENGCLYHLGTEARKKNYKNPYETGLVKVFFSSISESSRYKDLVGRSLENCRTSNQKDSYMGLDFGKNRTLIPKQYSIRNRDSLKHVLLNWVLEASWDYQDWHEIDERVHYSDNEKLNNLRKKQRKLLMQKGVVTTWAVDAVKLKGVVKSFCGDFKSFKGFRYFRIKQIGPNSSDSFNLVISGVEFYGTAYGKWDFEK